MDESDFEGDLMDPEGLFEDETEGDEFLGPLLSAAGPMLAGLFGESEDEAWESGLFEGEFEGDFEGDFESDEGEAEALMELLVDQLVESESEGDEFLPILASLAPLAVKAVSKLAPVAARVARRVVPRLARGVMQIGKRLMRSPAGKQALRTLPTIAKGAARQVLRAHAAGRPVTGQTVTRALAGQTAKVLRNPRRRRYCIHRSRRIARAAKPRLRAVAAR
jgi:hypothetical protein